ncbi:transcriptional regulator ATRX homolog isoform X2 [Myzus persicae]|uniref:transcriptional regulator ATRX homolog isoform X2 n=1 Tax=Myzus persicae TaxID=13164 RepID=UPI000B936E39|nr:transcriptional regulator ATRX homolog isoform X2 [Myzus persicae]
METVYPNNDEIQFRQQHFGVVEDILNSKVECAICNHDLLNYIILKKIIMVHQSYLFLCCHNCFYKLCEVNNYSCILCASNIDQSVCVKCNLNICKRCIENYKIETLCDGTLYNCFACVPQMLWKQRAQAANVLKVFCSQLCMPSGLLVNEPEHEQAVRKYLIKEAKVGQNSLIDSIRNNLCVDFVLKSYKSFIINELSEFSFDNASPLDENLNGFSNIFESILEKTCSTLTNFKSIFNMSSHLSRSVSDMMKSLCIDKDEHIMPISYSRINENLDEVMKNNSSNLSLNKSNICTTRILRSQNKYKTDIEFLNSNVSFSSSLPPKPKVIDKKLIVTKKQLNKSNTSSVNNDKSSNEVNIDLVKDKLVDPEHLFKDNDSNDRIENTKKLSIQNVLKINKTKNQAKNSIKNKKVPNEGSDEKENDSLMYLNDVENCSKKKIRADEVNTNNTDIIQTNNTSFKVSPKKEVHKLKQICQIVKKNNELDCDDVNNSQITNPIKCDIDSYRETCEETQSDLNNVDTIHGFGELENEEIVEMCVSSVEHNNKNLVTCSKQLSPLTMPLVINDDNDSDFEVFKNRGTKRMLIMSDSPNDSDSSIIKTKNPKIKNQMIKQSIFDLSTSSSSSDESSTSKIVNKRRRMRLSNERSDENSDNNKTSHDHVTPIKGRKNIRRLLTQKELSESTQNAIKEEELRKKRIQERQQLYNNIYDVPTSLETETCKKLVLDFDVKTNEELVAVHPDLVKFLKPHQVKGITFLWNSVFESLSRIKEHKGNGSILAHCMGLGKTLQIIALVHTLFRYPETGIKTVLIITPNATIENWCKEFHKWLHGIDEKKNFFVLNLAESKTYESRKNIIVEWRREHGVLITSYELYRSVVNYKYIDKFPSILEGLVDPGPDLIICDEGHVLKNHLTTVSKSVNRIKTLRRIVLTGTPLQNNLKEYHCMVDFIRPNLLGSIKDFTNRFINPITNGQYSDSTPLDVELMKGRSHVLHKMLEGFVQRFDYSVLTPYLPPKHEYVIYLKLSPKQIELYQTYLDSYRQPDLFTNYNMLQIVWTHPKLLAIYADRTESKREKQKLKDISYIDSFSNSVEGVENRHIPVSILNSSITKKPNTYLKWWKPYVSKSDLESVYPYSKFIMMFSILLECEKIGDKVLLFSQSLFTLDLIQDFLENAEDKANDKGGPYGKSWDHGADFYRIDGSVNLKEREDYCEQFNDVNNPRMRLLLLSTKAFNLGINLVGANRVIIFDMTWNPSLNVQSIFRVFRFGQTKPCYIYRFISEGTMEQKIYERQISKLSMAFRVVDEHQIDRHFNAKCQEELYEFEPNITKPKSTLNLPKDRLMAELILRHEDLVMNILEHDSLLQNNEAEELDENGRNAAWENYKKENDSANVSIKQSILPILPIFCESESD